jgi:hypothetical protein
MADSSELVLCSVGRIIALCYCFAVFAHLSFRAIAPGERSPFSPFGGVVRSENPVAIFYGSGSDFDEACVPDELRWRVETLGVQLESGSVSTLDVISAIKSAMPPHWLAQHGMDADYTSIAFSKNNRELLDIYVAALRAWGAENIVGPDIDDSVLSRGIVPIESISATSFDIPKTLGQPNARGFSFRGDNLQVTFPNGPISCFTEALVGPMCPHKFAHFSFKDLGGNSAWSVGVIPDAQSQDSAVLWGHKGSIGRHYSGSGSSLPQLRRDQGDMLTSCIDAVQGVWYLCVNGKIVAREHVPAQYFPVRLGLCGHNGSSFELIPRAAIPPEVASQYKPTCPASGPVIWQVNYIHSTIPS